MSYSETIKNYKIKKEYIIMGIETSCDDTAVAIVKNGREILADQIISSAVSQAEFGGVVPEIASRAHTEAILTAAKEALKEASLTLNDIDAFAVTYGAGLLGALLVGVSFGKALAFALNKPLIPVNHIRGHIAAAYLQDKDLKPPFITLLASGGHTAIINVKNYDEFEVIGSTLDDAAGEAFDKTARILGLSYPGGPNIEKAALSGQKTVKLPEMLKGKRGYDFSYSGLKTAVMNYVEKAARKGKVNVNDVACSFQAAAVDVLIKKSVAAVKEKNYRTLTVGGGVAANGYLRENLKKICEKEKIKLILPEKRYCTDNGAMIAAEGAIQYEKGNFADTSLNAVASIPLRETLK